MEVARLIEVMELPVGARILDCPCGQGRHAHLLAEAGYDVDGLDYSPQLLEAARAYCTLYEIRAALEEVFGAYREPVFF